MVFFPPPSNGSAVANLVSVKDHGAVGDGTTDDRAALQSALDVAYAAKKDLFFPSGKYKTVGYVDVASISGIRFVGAPGAEIHFSSDDTSVVADGTATSDNAARSAFLVRNCNNVTFSDLVFVGGTSHNITTENIGCAVYATKTVGLIIERCNARGGYSLLNQDGLGETNGSGDSLAVSSSVVTVTDAAALFKSGHVGRRITISGTTNSGNAGTFEITEYVSATQVKFSNADGVNETSSFEWTIDDSDRGTRIETCRSENQRGLITVGSDSVIRDVVIERPTSTLDLCGYGDSLSLVSTTVTLTDAAGRFKPSHHGKIVTIQNATSSANNGKFRITYISATQISWTNASGVAESFPGRWWIANGENAGLGAGASGLVASGGNVTLTADTASFTANDVGKVIRITGATTTTNLGAFVITAYVGPTQVTWANASGVTEAFSGIWSIDSFDRGSGSGDTYGSTHGIYIFAGRRNIKVEGCTFRGIRTTCVKASGSSLPVRSVIVRNCYAEECGNFFTAGADDMQEHTDLVCEGNTLVDVGTGSYGRSEAIGVAILGARGVRIVGNHFHYTRDAIAACSTGGVAGHYAITAQGGYGGNSQPLEDVTIDGNKFTLNPGGARGASVTNAAIYMRGVGLRSKYSSTGTLTKSGSTMTLTDAGMIFLQEDVGKFLQLVNAPNSGNNNYFIVTAVPSSTSIEFENASGVGGGVSAGTWRMWQGLGGETSAAYSNGFASSSRVTRNEIYGTATIAIYSLNNVAPEIVDNQIAYGAIYVDGDCIPRVARNRSVATNASNAVVRIFDGTSWPIVYDNVAANPNAGVSSAPSSFVVGDSAGDVTDYPLLGRTGRALPTQAKQEVVIAYGSLLVDGDYVTVNGSTFTYKATSPSSSQFNSFSDLVAKIDALAGVTCSDYGDPWSISTKHLKIAEDTASATPNTLTVSAYGLNATALVPLYNHTAGTYQVKGRGEGSAGPTADKTVVWSPMCSYAGNVHVMAGEATAMTLLAGGSRMVKNYLNAGSCEVIAHGTSAGTEEVRWTVQG